MWVRRRACSGSSRCSRPACRWSGGTGPGLPCRSSSRSPRTSRGGRGRASRSRCRYRRRPAAAGRIAAAGAVAPVRAAAALRVAGSLAAGSTGCAAARLGEATLRVEVLLGRGEHEFLSAVRTGQVLVAVHENETPLGSRTRSRRVLASAVRGVRVVSSYVSGHGPFRGVYGRDGTRFSNALPIPDFCAFLERQMGSSGATANRCENCLHQMIALAKSAGSVPAGSSYPKAPSVALRRPSSSAPFDVVVGHWATGRRTGPARCAPRTSSRRSV